MNMEFYQLAHSHQSNDIASCIVTIIIICTWLLLLLKIRSLITSNASVWLIKKQCRELIL